jgi:hypothetical protein
MTSPITRLVTRPLPYNPQKSKHSTTHGKFYCIRADYLLRIHFVFNQGRGGIVFKHQGQPGDKRLPKEHSFHTWDQQGEYVSD